MNTHVKTIGYLYIAFGVLGLIAAGAFLLAMLGGRAVAEGEAAKSMVVVVGTFLSAITALLSLPMLAGGIGLLGAFRWARMLVLLLAVLILFHPPFGTALGAYTLWALLANEDVKRSFEARTSA